MKMVDDTEPQITVDNLLRTIRHKIRECRKHKIDYNSYVDTKDLEYIVEMLDCCLEHKDSRYIMKVEE